MTIIKDICKIHESPTGQKRITLSKDYSTMMDLPLKTKLLIEYNTEKRILTVREL